jgi:hypothetical protein
MDYDQFLEEINECYRLNGLEPGYGLDRLATSPVNLGIATKSTHVPLKAAEKQKWLVEKSKSNRIILDKHNANESEKLELKRQYKFFNSLADLVYTLAWELAENIGRLPDNLHSRMVLSTDKHKSRIRYIEKFGA